MPSGRTPNLKSARTPERSSSRQHGAAATDIVPEHADATGDDDDSEPEAGDDGCGEVSVLDLMKLRHARTHTERPRRTHK